MFSSNHLLSIVSLFHWLCHDYYKSKFILDSFIFWVFPARFLRRLAANVDFSTRSCDFPHQYCSILLFLFISLKVDNTRNDWTTCKMWTPHVSSPFFSIFLLFKYNVSCSYSDNYNYNLENHDRGDVDSTCKPPPLLLLLLLFKIKVNILTKATTTTTTTTIIWGGELGQHNDYFL